MAESVTLTGVDEMRRQLRELPAEINKQGILNRALLAGAKTLRDEARAKAPVKTGALQKSIIVYRDRNPARSVAKYSVFVRKIKISKKVKKLLRKVRIAGTKLRISDDTFYWKFIEFGWSGLPGGSPFFRPAIMIVEPQLVRIVGDELQRGIDAALRRAGAK